MHAMFISIVISNQDLLMEHEMDLSAIWHVLQTSLLLVATMYATTGRLSTAFVYGYNKRGDEDDFPEARLHASLLSVH